MGVLLFLLGLAPGPPLTSGEVRVSRTADRLDVAAQVAPVATVLEAIARNSGMKVTYEGPPPRVLVTVALTGTSPREAVLKVVEGLGLSYVMAGGEGGTEGLLMVSGGAARAVARSTGGPNASPDEDVENPAPDAPEVPSEDDRMMMRRRFREGMERPPGMERPAGADNKPAEPADARPAENEPAAGEPGIARPLQLPTPPPDGAGRNRMGGPGGRRNGGGQQQQPN